MRIRIIDKMVELHKKAKRLLSGGTLEEACRLFTQFIDEHRDCAEHRSAVTDAYNSRGHIKYLSVDFPGAIADYSTALERDPGFAVAWYNRGQVRYRLGRYKAAEGDLLQALKLDPNFTDAQVNLEQVQKDLQNGHRFNNFDCTDTP